MAAIKRHVTIAETAEGWEVRDGNNVALHKAAAEAQAAVQAADTAACDNGAKAVITVITWAPSTKLGSLVVWTLTKHK